MIRLLTTALLTASSLALAEEKAPEAAEGSSEFVSASAILEGSFRA